MRWLGNHPADRTPIPASPRQSRQPWPHLGAAVALILVALLGVMSGGTVYGQGGYCCTPSRLTPTPTPKSGAVLAVTSGLSVAATPVASPVLASPTAAEVLAAPPPPPAPPVLAATTSPTLAGGQCRQQAGGAIRCTGDPGATSCQAGANDAVTCVGGSRGNCAFSANGTVACVAPAVTRTPAPVVVPAAPAAQAPASVQQAPAKGPLAIQAPRQAKVQAPPKAVAPVAVQRAAVKAVVPAAIQRAAPVSSRVTVQAAAVAAPVVSTPHLPNTGSGGLLGGTATNPLAGWLLPLLLLTALGLMTGGIWAGRQAEGSRG